ncbi:hypothetical protein ACEQ8H_002781 [Pleosporales sp. CAS-2024a]
MHQHLMTHQDARPLHTASEEMPLTKRILLAAALASITPPCLLLFNLHSATGAIGSRSDYSSAANSRQTVFLPWTKPFSRSPSYQPSISGSIAGQPLTFPIDTTTTGVVIGAPYLPKLKLSAGNLVGWRFLDTNSVLLTGRIATLPMTFYGTTKSHQAIAHVPVLIVTKIVRCPGYDVYKDGGVCPAKKVDKKYKQSLRSVLSMGVGFGTSFTRGDEFHQSPAYNPLLQAMRVGESKMLPMRPGYMFSARGVHVGLGDDEQHDDVLWTRLGKMPGSSDADAWSAPRVQLTIGHPSANQSVSARMLIDLGVTHMAIQSSRQVSLSAIAAASGSATHHVRVGTKLGLAFMDMGVAVAGYEFVVGDARFPGEPSYVEVITKGGVPFVSPGRNLLYGFSLVYDGVKGRFGVICEACKVR